MAKRRKSQLSRGWKTVRNFAALALVLAGCWTSVQTPFLLMEYDMRKDAAQELTILWRGSLDGGVYGGGGAPPVGGVPMVIACGEDQLHARAMGSYEGYIWLRGSAGIPLVPGTPTVFCSRELADVRGPTHDDLYLLAVDLPENAVRGEVRVAALDGTAYTTSGKRDMDVIWFPLSVDTDSPYPCLINAAYALTLYDENGIVLSQTQGLLHEEVAS